MKKKYYVIITVILLTIVILYLLKNHLNEYYNLWYINQYGYSYNKVRKKFRYEIIPNNWYKIVEFEKESNRYSISWQINLDTLIQNNRPAFYSKSLTFYSYGLFDCKLFAEEDVYINLWIEKLKYFRVINIHNYIEGNNIYMFNFDLQDTNFLTGFKDYQELKKTTLNFPFDENLTIRKETYDSILISWHITPPSLVIDKQQQGCGLSPSRHCK